VDETRRQFICEGTDAEGSNTAKCRRIDIPNENEARLKAILDTTVDGIITIDIKGIIQSFNKAAENIFGYSAHEVVGKNIKVLQPPPYRERHDEFLVNYLRTGTRKVIGIGREVEGQRKDGSTFPLYLAVSEAWSGTERFFTGVLRDLTEQKAATEQIKTLARFPEESPHPVLRLSNQGYLLYANPASECVLETFSCKIGQTFPCPWRDTILDILQSGRSRELEVQCGSRTFSLTLVPSPDARDINVYGRDITARKAAEEALRESEEKHRTLVQSSSDAILVIDRNRQITSFNQAFLDLFGLTKAESEGQSTRIFHPSEASYAAFGEIAFPTIESSGSFRTEWEFVKKDGTSFPVEETLSAIKVHDGSIFGYVAILRDITERKEAEQKLTAYRERLEDMVAQRTHELEDVYKTMLQEEKLKTLGSISAELAHEIRNPLTSIGGFARRLQKKNPDSPEVSIIVEESSRLEEILRRIENYLKPVELRPKECSVNEIINEAVALVSPEFHLKGININMGLAGGLSPAYVDPAVLIQVLINVIHNAAKVMQEDGKITVETFETDQNVHIAVRAPLGHKSHDPELIFSPFGENRGEISVPVCFRLLSGMGGHLSLVYQDDSVVFAASLLKAVGGAAGEEAGLHT
jgi:two-component system cell cycle sensor histidine kinase/response regulator CckA